VDEGGLILFDNLMVNECFDELKLLFGEWYGFV